MALTEDERRDKALGELTGLLAHNPELIREYLEEETFEDETEKLECMVSLWRAK